MRVAGGFLALLTILAPAASACAGQPRCWFENGAVVVPASFGPIVGDFILDLSAPRSELHVTPARAHGIEGDEPTATLRIAGETIADLPMRVADLDDRGRGFVTNIVGVLGADVAARFRLDLRYAPCRLRLRGFSRASGATDIALKMIAGVPTVPALLSDGRHVRTGAFAIDTGSWTSGIPGATLSRRPPAGAAPAARIRAVEVGGRFFEQVPAALATDPPAAGMAGTLGNAIWSRFEIDLDLRRGRLGLIPISDRRRATGCDSWRRAGPRRG